MGLVLHSQALRGLLGGEVALRCRQHFVADHEFPDGRGTQQRREEVGVQLPVGMIARRGRFSVPAHRIGEAGLEEIVIYCQKASEEIGEGVSLFGGKVRQVLAVAPRQ